MDTAISQPPPAAEWPQQNPVHPFGITPPSWPAPLTDAERTELGRFLTAWTAMFWSYADVRMVVRKGLDGEQAMALSYDLAACAVECSALLADIDQRAQAAA